MSSRSTGTTRTGLGAIDSKHFDAMAAVGGWLEVDTGPGGTRLSGLVPVMHHA